MLLVHVMSAKVADQHQVAAKSIRSIKEGLPAAFPSCGQMMDVNSFVQHLHG